jgi:hypothetical protein
MCERLLLNEFDPTDIELEPGAAPDMVAEAVERFFAIEPIISKNVETVYNIEDKVFSHELETAGTSDGRVKWAGTDAVIDYKNKRKRPQPKYMDDYRCQMYFYGKGFEELLDTPSDIGIIVASYYTAGGTCKADYWTFDLMDEGVNEQNKEFLLSI